MKHKYHFYVILCLLLMAYGCKNIKKTDTEDQNLNKPNDSMLLKMNTAEEILAKPEIPVLCYHKIANGTKSEYSVTPQTFESHIKMLSDSGFHSISPDQLYNYLVYNQSLPDKPFMISFDDSRIEHFEIAAPTLQKYGFRGVFFIMTITYNKKNYMTTEQISMLSKNGHTVGLHSWDHTMATKYTDSISWQKQLIFPKSKLEQIIGKPVAYWAYPNGVYNHESAKQLSKYMKLSFILSSKRDSILPLQTVRRIIVPDYTASRLIKSIDHAFLK